MMKKLITILLVFAMIGVVSCKKDNDAGSVPADELETSIVDCSFDDFMRGECGVDKPGADDPDDPDGTGVTPKDPADEPNPDPVREPAIRSRSAFSVLEGKVEEGFVIRLENYNGEYRLDIDISACREFAEISFAEGIRGDVVGRAMGLKEGECVVKVKAVAAEGGSNIVEKEIPVEVEANPIEVTTTMPATEVTILAGQESVDFEVGLGAAGGTGEYIWSVVAIPQVMDSTGMVPVEINTAVTPPVAVITFNNSGTYQITVTASDADERFPDKSGSETYAIEVTKEMVPKAHLMMLAPGLLKEGQDVAVFQRAIDSNPLSDGDKTVPKGKGIAILLEGQEGEYGCAVNESEITSGLTVFNVNRAINIGGSDKILACVLLPGQPEYSPTTSTTWESGVPVVVTVKEDVSGEVVEKNIGKVSVTVDPCEVPLRLEWVGEDGYRQTGAEESVGTDGVKEYKKDGPIDTNIHEYIRVTGGKEDYTFEMKSVVWGQRKSDPNPREFSESKCKNVKYKDVKEDKDDRGRTVFHIEGKHVYKQGNKNFVPVSGLGDYVGREPVDPEERVTITVKDNCPTPNEAKMRIVYKIKYPSPEEEMVEGMKVRIKMSDVGDVGSDPEDSRIEVQLFDRDWRDNNKNDVGELFAGVMYDHLDGGRCSDKRTCTKEETVGIPWFIKHGVTWGHGGYNTANFSMARENTSIADINNIMLYIWDKGSMFGKDIDVDIHKITFCTKNYCSVYYDDEARSTHNPTGISGHEIHNEVTPASGRCWYGLGMGCDTMDGERKEWLFGTMKKQAKDYYGGQSRVWRRRSRPEYE